MKKVLFYAFLLPAFVGMMFSCSDVKTDVKKLEGKWNVVEVKGEKVLEEGLPQMDFNMAEKKLHGNTGCNLFNTTITLDPEDVSSITIAPGATTMMACPNMDLETSVLQSMDQVRSVKAGKDENEMLLVDQDGNVLLELMRKGLFYICLLLVGVGLFAGCKSKKAVVASFSDLDGEWGVVEMNGKTLNPEETHQVLVFDVARQGLSGNAGCNRLMGKIEYNDAYKNIIKFPQVATTRMACPDMSGERELLEALNKVVRFEAQGEAAPVTEIALFGTNNDKLLVIKKQK